MAAITAYLGDCAEYFTVFGALAASYLALKLICSLWGGIKNFILAKSLGLGTDLKKLGQWAVVTGSTDGIGKAYAQELAGLGMDVVLISRTLEKLNDVAAEIQNKYKVQTKVIAVDFCGGAEIYDKIEKELKDLEIGVLVNNVGMAYSHPEFFGELDVKTVRDLININCNSVAEMTRIVLPRMAERRKGAILNISSASGVRPTPMLGLYSSTKAFVDCFSHCLATEYKAKNVIIQSVVPFFVATKLSKIRRTSVFVPSPTTYAKSALATVGLQTRTFGCMSHALQGAVVNSFPACIHDPVAMSQMIATKKRALKKLQKKE